MNLCAKKRSDVPALAGALTIALLLLPVGDSGVAKAAGWAGASHTAESLLINDDDERINELMSRARAAAERGRWREAVGYYDQVLEIAPDHQEALRGRREALVMLDDAPVIEHVGEQIEILRARARAEYDAAVRRANQAIEEERYEDARMEVITARTRLEGQRGYLPRTEYEEKTGVLESMVREVRQREQEARLIAEARRREEMLREAEEEELRRRLERERHINENLRRARELQMEMRYTEALQVVEEILFLDDLHPAALLMRDVLKNNQIYQDYVETERRRQESYTRLRAETMRASIAPDEVITYPDDWPELSTRRTGAAGWFDDASTRQVNRILAEARVPVDFDRARFEDALAYLSNVTNLQIHPEWRALESIGIHRDDEVNLSLREVSADVALRRMLDQLGDDWSRPQFAVQDGLVVVSSERAMRKNRVTAVYDIRDLLFEVPYFDNAPVLDLNTVRTASAANNGQSSGAFGSNNDGRGTGSTTRPFRESGEEPQRRTREDIVDQLINIIIDTVDSDGWRERGGDTGSIQELNGNLIIQNTPQNHRQIEGLLQQLREVRALQINVEGRFLTVSTNWFEKIGVDLDLYFNTNRTAFRQLRAADPTAHLSDFFGPSGRLRDPLIFTTETDEAGNFLGPVPFGNTFGLPVGDIPEDGFMPLGYAVGPVGSPIRSTQGFTPIGVVQDHFRLVDTLAQFDPVSFAGIATASNPALSFGVQFLDDIQVDLLIEATQADRRSVILTAPRLTLFNGQRAWVAVQTTNFYVTGLFPVVGDGVGVFQPDVVPIPDGVILDIEAVVSADRRYVTMTVSTSVSEVTDGRLITAQGAVAGAGFAGGAATTFGTEFTAPEITTAAVRTTVSVPDKGTVLLGGQRLVREVEVETGVPVLSKIPIVNRFFTNRVTAKDEESLLILIRPEIIIQQEREDLLFPGLSDQLGGGGGSFLY